MKKKPAFLLSLFLALTLLLSGCDSQYGVTVVTTPQTPAASSAPLAPEAPNPPEAPDQEGYYYDLENVVLYLSAYGELPPNYITKAEARELGWEGDFIMWATELQPFWMGILVSTTVGIALTLPISSAAICASFGLVGLAGGAAVAGCCAQMVGFAVMSFRENRWGGLISQGIGTSMLQMGNIVKNPGIWIPPILTSAITGPVATCLFRLEMNGAPVSSGMGTCGFVGQIGVWTGWLAPSEKALANGAAAISPSAFHWMGLILVSFVLPAVICWLLGLLCRRLRWIREGDLKL